MNMSSSRPTDLPHSEVERLAHENREMTRHRFFFGYLYARIRSTSLWAHWQRWLSYFRRFRTVTIVWRVLVFIFSVLQTGALVLLSTLLFVIILPLFIVLMLGILITAAIESRRSNRFLREKLAGRRVCILFLPPQKSDFFEQHAARLTEEGFSVLIVSPYLLSSRGIGSRNGFYSTLRREAPDLYLVRKYYFFSLQKHVLRSLDVAFLY